MRYDTWSGKGKREPPPPQLARDIRTKLAQLPGQAQENVSPFLALIFSEPPLPSGWGGFVLANELLPQKANLNIVAECYKGIFSYPPKKVYFSKR
jgi:hypothetical protein